jgi:putative ABC transport system substrate-binding protein
VNLLISEVGSKRLAILAELLPTAAIIAFMVNPQNPESEIETGDALAGARALGRQGFIVSASNEPEIEAAFTKIVQRRANALFVGSDPLFNSRRNKIISLAAQHNLPAIYPFRQFAEAADLLATGQILRRHTDKLPTMLAGFSMVPTRPIYRSYRQQDWSWY